MNAAVKKEKQEESEDQPSILGQRAFGNRTEHVALGDGNCLFHSSAFLLNQIFEDETGPDELRQDVADLLERIVDSEEDLDPQFYHQFIANIVGQLDDDPANYKYATDVQGYIDAVGSGSGEVWGDSVCIQAIADLNNVIIYVINDRGGFTIFNPNPHVQALLGNEDAPTDELILILYGQTHYNAISDEPFDGKEEEEEEEEEKAIRALVKELAKSVATNCFNCQSGKAVGTKFCSNCNTPTFLCPNCSEGKGAHAVCPSCEKSPEWHDPKVREKISTKRKTASRSAKPEKNTEGCEGKKKKYDSEDVKLALAARAKKQAERLKAIKNCSCPTVKISDKVTTHVPIEDTNQGRPLDSSERKEIKKVGVRAWALARIKEIEKKFAQSTNADAFNQMTVCVTVMQHNTSGEIIVILTHNVAETSSNLVATARREQEFLFEPQPIRYKDRQIESSYYLWRKCAKEVNEKDTETITAPKGAKGAYARAFNHGARKGGCGLEGPEPIQDSQTAPSGCSLHHAEMQAVAFAQLNNYTILAMAPSHVCCPVCHRTLVELGLLGQVPDERQGSKDY